jgi:hypothetical protein
VYYLVNSEIQTFGAIDVDKYNYLSSVAGCEVFTAVVMKSIIVWDMTPYSPLNVNRRFGGTYRLYLQGRRNKFSKKPASKQVATSVDTTRTTRRHIPENDTLHIFKRT